MQNKKLAALFLAAAVAFSSLNTGTAVYAMENGGITEETVAESEEAAITDQIIGDYASDNSSDEPVADPSAPVRIRNINLDKSDVKMYPGDKVVITARITPENASNKKLIWTVLDDDEAVSWKQVSGLEGDSLVSAIEITALKPGGVNVYVSSEEDPDCRNYCWIEIRQPEDSWEGSEPIEKNGIKIYGVHDWEYNGQKREFDFISIFDEGRRLTEKTDYTISYKDNINAGTAKMMINLKGDYSGSVEVPFTINPALLEYDSENKYYNFSWAVKTAYVNGKTQHIVPNISKYYTLSKYTKLKGSEQEGKGDFTYSYPSTEEGAYVNAGYWPINITFNGNYTGSVTIYENLKNKSSEKNISFLKVTLEKTTFNFNEITVITEDDYGNKKVLWDPSKINIKVMDGNKELDKIQYSYYLNPKLGKTQLAVGGTGYSTEDNPVSYTGYKYVPITVKGNEITQNNISLEGLKDEYPFVKNNPVDPSITIKYNGNPVENNEVYVSQIQGTNKPGTAKITVTGNSYYGYTGTVTKTFKIAPGDLTSYSYTVTSKKGDYYESFEFGPDSKSEAEIFAPYRVGGATLEYLSQLYIPDRSWLEEGKDYSVTYTNNKKVGDKATATIKGLNNYKGSKPVEIKFTVTGGVIDDRISYAPDMNESPKKWKSTPVVFDDKGGKLNPKTDYTIEQYWCEGRDLDKEAPKAGDTVMIEIEGKGNFEGEHRTVMYKIVDPKKNIAKATFKIKDQVLEVKGREVILTSSDFTTAIAPDKTTQLVYGSDFIITGYKANTKKGTATVTLKGIGNYGGTKTATFKIGAKVIKK